MAKEAGFKRAGLGLKLAVLFLCSGLSGFSQTTNSFFQFVNAQSERRYSEVPHEVLAFYYGWYSEHDAHRVGGEWGVVDLNKHEIQRTACYPAKGAYDSHDPAVIDWQIDQAKEHGITGFFNATNIPVFVCIAGESYTSSIKTTDDVPRSLVRYLREGGFLVSIPIGPWPFSYDDSRKGIPLRITDKLALGVTDGFEQPPTGTELKFYVNKSALLGLPPTAAFPTNGDLRFRPASRSRVPPADYYLPLVQLWDGQMRPQGDAAVYIQHKTPPLSPGKSIYVWMRTPEALGPDEFYPSLYQFISTKLKPH